MLEVSSADSLISLLLCEGWLTLFDKQNNKVLNKTNPKGENKRHGNNTQLEINIAR